MKMELIGDYVFTRIFFIKNKYSVKSIQKVYFTDNLWEHKRIIISNGKRITVKDNDIVGNDTFLDDIGSMIGNEKIICIDDDIEYPKIKRKRNICIVILFFLILFWQYTFFAEEIQPYQCAILTRKIFAFSDKDVYVRKKGILFNSECIDCYTRGDKRME